MPYMKRKDGDKICVYKKGENGEPQGDSLGCHDSEEEANRQIAAVYANEKSLKFVGEDEETIRVRNHIVLWGDSNTKDLEGLGSPRKNADGSIGEYFTPETIFESDYTKSGVLHVDWEHGRDPDDIGNHKDTIIGYVDWKTAQKDEDGLIVDRVLNRRHKYMAWLETLIKAGLVGSSSESVAQATKKAPDGRIIEWPLRRDTFTVNPMESRMMSQNVLEAMKALDLLSGKSDSTEEGSAEPPADQTSGSDKDSQKGEVFMDPILLMLKALVPSLTDDQAKAVMAVIQSQQPKASEPAPAKVEIKQEDLMAALKALGLSKPEDKKPEEPPEGTRPPYDFGTNKAEPKPEEKAMSAAYVLRFGDTKAEEKAILEDVLGTSYQKDIMAQNKAFGRYVRFGERALDSIDQKALTRQIFPLHYILDFVRDGAVSIDEIKTTMIEAQGDLGGYAVPPNVQSEIMKRLPGLTVVRGAGATVITLANGNSVDIPEYTGGNDRYVGALRGAWGNETKSPGAKNATVGLVQLTANIYTYKIPMSQTLVEDAVNLLALIQTDISDVMAMDEDDAYLIGDGVGKPYGILPGSTNALSLTEVNSGSASVLTTQGIKALKRGIAAQYRKSGVYVGNSDTFGAVERFQSTDGKFIFDDLTDTNMLAGRRVFESEAMPDIAANAYPLLFCDMSGYTIVERLGLTIARYQDSYTGINVVEYQVRRRVGGRLAKPWLFSVQKVSA